MSDRQGSLALAADDFRLAAIHRRNDPGRRYRPAAHRPFEKLENRPPENCLLAGRLALPRPPRAEYLASLQIKALGVESFDPDWVDLQHLGEAEFPAHRLLLAKGILILENLANWTRSPAGAARSSPCRLNSWAALPRRSA